MSNRWQYLTAEVPTSVWGSPKPDELQQELDRRGREGWELVGILPTSPNTIAKPLLIFKKAG
ncbi:MAG TPA: DUF4177 domain-containing protein [Pseudoxanthomonas sp.]|nr:DUF4177 domain-containing protein [Pseudoxanthomonas sp.]